MYPPEFTEWVGDKAYYRVKGIWYTWLKDEKMDTPVADNTDKLFKIWQEQNKKAEE